ncbi:trans-sialidase [Trypanosoma rangeli]|uniref:Trans-sialidase n=1 Tax=Trypanosoma rangeli TaxID=5698 RepID=A0A3R7NDJ5_TRYRA|nr:trans-sialidase [Trypanosoma rangeli]RNF01081.1 trans-sialidase [Trypanosoma rangeli]|eukprot:RNF01081.1 trans-sialidase [Trypanosoma rangeli]
MMTPCESGYRRVYEYTDGYWKESHRMLSGVWGNSKGRHGAGKQSGFINANIDGKEVLLVTSLTEAVQGTKIFNGLHLWVSDGNRVVHVGLISPPGRSVGSSTLLYARGNLFSLHVEDGEKGSAVVLTHLSEELTRVKRLLSEWKTLGNKYSASCTRSAANPGLDGECGPAVPTDGLVSVFAGKHKDNAWQDSYGCSSAVLKNAIPVTNGFKFGGHDAGAFLPVSYGVQHQPYHFAHHNFTLLATVTMDGDKKDHGTVLGVRVRLPDKLKKRFGLGHNHGRWIALYGKNRVSSGVSWSAKQAYQVALVVQNGMGTIYIDQKPLKGAGGRVVNFAAKEEIVGFYFGAGVYGTLNRGKKTNLTVTNVFLYNRPLSPAELPAPS